MKDSMLENLLKTIADITGETDGAFNLRKDGVGVIRHSTENIEIKTKEDKIPAIYTFVLYTGQRNGT